MDQHVIEELRALDEGQGDVLRQLVEMFVASAEGRINKMDQALGTGDLRGLSAEAHGFKSSCANLGANRMASLCQQLEHAKTPEAAAKLGDLPSKLRAEFALASSELHAAASKKSGAS